MKNFTTALKNHYALPVTTRALCVRFTRRDGVVIGATTHTRSLTIDGVSYDPDNASTFGNLHSAEAMAVSNSQLSGPLDSLGADLIDVLEGRWNNCEVYAFEINYKSPPTTLAVSAGAPKDFNVLFKGWFGNWQTTDVAFSVELRSLAQKLNVNIGAQILPSCRHHLGDINAYEEPVAGSFCGVDLGPLIVTSTITDVESRRAFLDSARAEADGEFTYGWVHFVTGLAAGLRADVKKYTTGRIELTEPLWRELAVGDTYRMAPGCDKSFNGGCTKYNNKTRFGGFPYVPGQDAVVRGVE